MSLDWSPDYNPDDDEPPPICPVTKMYCTGQFCDDYGCAKEAGIWDEEYTDA